MASKSGDLPPKFNLVPIPEPEPGKKVKSSDDWPKLLDVLDNDIAQDDPSTLVIVRLGFLSLFKDQKVFEVLGGLK